MVKKNKSLNKKSKTKKLNKSSSAKIINRSVKSNKNQPLKRLLLKALMCVLIAVLVILVVNKNKPDYFKNQDSVFCGLAGQNNLICENLNNHKLTKYYLPEKLRGAQEFIPSPDQKQYVIYGWQQPKRGDYDVDNFAYVVDAKFNIVKTIDVCNFDCHYTWVGNDKIIFDRYEEEGNSFQTRSASLIDLANNNKTAIIDKSKKTSYEFVGANDQYLFINKLGPITDDLTTKHNLVAVDLDTKSQIKIDTTKLDELNKGTNIKRLTYKSEKNLFYANSQDDDDKYDIDIATLTDQSGKFELTTVKTVHSDFAISQYPAFILTSKGALANSYSYYKNDDSADHPYIVVDTKDKVTKTQIYSLRSVYFGLKKQPELEAAKNNQPVIGDYIDAPANLSTKVKKFLESRVTEGCKPGNYRQVELWINDNDQQLNTSEGGCGVDGSVYYIYKNGKFRYVTATQEGLDCEGRDALGLSKVVAPSCRKPGEEL